MDYVLKAKKNDKWWIFGNLKTNQYGKNQASFKIADLKNLILEAEKEGKSYLYFSLFDNIPRPAEKQVAKPISYADDPIPF